MGRSGQTKRQCFCKQKPGGGIKQVRRVSSGTKSYNSETTSAVHSHANNDNVIGFGEVSVVLNGVEFRTRHNDYALRMPSKTSKHYHAVDKIPYPPVPPSVTAKHSVQEQVKEMKEYFKAFRQQNIKIRDYRPYFKPVLCYLEGAWEKHPDKFREPYYSARYHVNAHSWKELVEKVKISAYTGNKGKREDLAFLPTTVMKNHNGIPEFAQWNYRILCHQIHGDVPLKAYKPIDDIAYRMTRKFNMSQYVKTEDARFTVASELHLANYDNSEGHGSFEDKQYIDGYLDRLMAQVPGVNNYPDTNHDNNILQGLARDVETGRPQNTAFYHRQFHLDKGPETAFRGFSDSNLWVAQNRNWNDISSPVIKNCKVVNHLQVNCTTYSELFTFAFPLEIIYLNPLHEWNPYHLPMKKNDTEVTNHGRTGHTQNAKMAYNGISSSHFYKTPHEFFGNIGGQEVGVLDNHGALHRVMASGIQTLLPNIPGVGIIRQRWPIYPTHNEGNSAGKESAALLELVNHMSALSPYFQEPPAPSTKITKQPDLLFKLIVTHREPPGSHDHEFYIPADDWEAMEKKGATIKTLTSEESGHSHVLQIHLDQHTNKPKIFKCDGHNSCWDGHHEFIQIM